jgi:hypothetical protein
LVRWLLAQTHVVRDGRCEKAAWLLRCCTARQVENGDNHMNWIYYPVGAYAAAVDWIETHGHAAFWCWVGSFIVAWWL